MISDFNDGYPPKFVDPLDGPSFDFDWDSVFRDVDRMSDSETGERHPAEVLAALLTLLLARAQGDKVNPKAVGLRLLAIGWVLNPANFPGSPSLIELAARCGVSPAALAQHTGEASRVLNWRNRAQRHAWNYKKAV